MTLPMNPLGDVIAAQAVTNVADLIAHYRLKRPKTVTVLDGDDLALRLKEELPDCLVVVRYSDWEPGPGQDYLKMLIDKVTEKVARYGNRWFRLALMVNCEQGFTRERVRMWADMIEYASAHLPALSLVVGNHAAGTNKCGQGGDPNWWLEWEECKRLLRLLAVHRQHHLGVHEYTSFFPWLVANGQWGDPLVVPTALDWLRDQWHLGRNVQGIMRACQKIDGGIVYPSVIITEGSFDDMQDVAKAYPGQPMGGWLTFARWWQKVYFGTSPAEQAFRDLVREWAAIRYANAEHVISDQDLLAFFHTWIWEIVYAPVGFVVGVHIFIWQDASGRNQWGDDRTDTAGTYRRHMEHYHPGNVPMPTPEPNPVDEPDDATQPLPTTPDENGFVYLVAKMKVSKKAVQMFSDTLSRFLSSEIHISTEEYKE